MKYLAFCVLVLVVFSVGCQTELPSEEVQEAGVVAEDENLVGEAARPSLGSRKAPLGQGPVGHWRFDEGSGNIAFRDSSGNGNNGTIQGDATWVSAGRIGSALEFDGTDDLVNLGNPEILRPGTSAWTLSLWFRTADADIKSSLLTKRDPTNVFNQMALYLGDTTQDINPGRFVHGTIVDRVTNPPRWWWYHTTSDVVDGGWHHVVLARPATGDSMIYIDGELVAIDVVHDTGTEPNNVDNQHDWRVGNNNGNNWHEGLIDDVQMYNRELSANEILTIYDEAPDADVEVSVGYAPKLETYSANDTVSFFIGLQNNGLDLSEGLVMVNDYDESLMIIDVLTVREQGGISCTDDGDVFTCTLESLEMYPFAQPQLSYSATLIAAGTVVNQASVSANTYDPDLNNNDHSVSLEVE